MPTLSYSFVGDNSSLVKAAQGSINAIGEVDKAFKGLSGDGINNISKAVSGLNGGLTTVSKSAKQSASDLRELAGVSALDDLGRKLLVIQGNASLFGESIKTQTQEISAYQTALNKLLSLGFDPLDGDVTALKGKIDSLTESMAANSAAAARVPSNFSSGNSGQEFAPIPTVLPRDSSGDSALTLLNADLEAGIITAEQYKKEIQGIAEQQAFLASQGQKSNVVIEEEIGLLAGLNAELKALQVAKPSITNVQDLAKQNALIQELEAEITRFGNVGKVGFDSTGVAIKNFGKEVEQSSGSLTNLGGGLTRGYGYLRQLAYILPGIGIAGIFNLAFEGIEKATEALGGFNTKLSLAQNNLNNLNSVVQNATKQYGEQSTNLRVLYQATQDLTNSETNRLLAAKELQKEFPSLFGNLTTEAILNGNAANAYKEATTAILDNSKALSARNKIAELAGKQQDADFQQLKINNARAAELSRVPASVAPTSNNVNSDVVATPRSVLIKQAQDAINQRADLSIKEQQQNKKDLQAQIDFLTQFAGGNNKIAQALSQGEKLKKDALTGGDSTFDSLNKQLDEILRKTTAVFDQSGLQGYALAVQKVNDKYKEQDTQIQSILNSQKKLLDAGKITPAQFAVANQKANNDFDATGQAKEKELSDLKIAEAERVSNEIQRINDEFGVKSEQSRAKEIAQIQKLYDTEIVKAQGNAEIIAALDAGRVTALQAINDRYLAQITELNDKIADINEFAINSQLGGEASATARIVKEWDSRKDAADKYFKQIKQITDSFGGQISATSTAFGLPDLNGVINKGISDRQSSVDAALDKDKQDAIKLSIYKPITDGITQAAGSFYTTLTEINSQTDKSFKGIFSDLTANLNKSVNNIFVNILEKQLTAALEKSIKNGTSGLFNSSGGLSALGYGVAGAGVVGGLISGATSKTSAVGQGIGGALTGAAIGTAILPGIGTAAGAIIGGIAGIFGANKAQKELQAQQLEQQKEQTALLKASLAYTSQIIGRQTANGIISNISVGATGQLVATVSGSDLQFVLDRNGKAR